MATTYASRWQLDSVHERLRHERTALGHSQQEFAGLMGVNRLTQLRYENGRKLPPLDYLRAAGLEGVDVQYVLTGRREA